MLLPEHSADSPPAYEATASSRSESDQSEQSHSQSKLDVKVDPEQKLEEPEHIPHPTPTTPISHPNTSSTSIAADSLRLTMDPSPNYVLPSPSTIYHYTHPETGENITSLLPPDHPQIICLHKGHVPVNRFGPVGIIAAIIWFPIGIALCMLDRRVKCSRCNEYINHGICS